MTKSHALKILLTGSGGMLGRVLVPCLESRGHIVKGMTRDELDVTDYHQVMDVFNFAKPDFVIHAAAYTKVDQAETEPEQAYLINGFGTENIAIACNTYNLPLLYISTDYVFDGEQDRPYTTWDKCRPLSIYGKSKLAGEESVQRHLTKFFIVRTSWLYGPYGRNFVDTILSMSEERNVLKVVSDQWGTPTCTLSLAETIADLIATGRWGIYHATDGGVTNWYEFAKAIIKDRNIDVVPIATKDMPRPATRPKYSVLDKTTTMRAIGREMIPWQEALQSYLRLLREKQPV